MSGTMNTTRSIRNSRKERGANLVEMALLVPLLLLLLVGVADLGRAYFTYITMINAAREGARHGVDHPADTGGIIARVLSEAELNGVDLAGADIRIQETGPSHPVTVTVTLDFDVILAGVLGQPSFPIQAHATFAAR
jgi:Flp pilus assembly protein TadG